jgi:sterol 3beta-glucosyltransferase
MAPTTSPGEASSSSPPPPTATIPALAVSAPDLPPPSIANESSESRVLRRVERKLSERLHEEESTHSPPLPAPLQDSDDDEDADAAPDPGPPLFMNMNQSIFGLIAAAGSKVNFNDRFDGISSDEEDADGDGHEHGHLGTGQTYRDRPIEDLSHTTILQPPPKQKQKAHRRMLSGGHKLLKSLPNLPKRKSKSKREPSKLSNLNDNHNQADSELSDLNEPLSPDPLSLSISGSRPLPVMSRMLEAKAEMASRPSFDLERLSGDFARGAEHGSATPLARRLMEIFEFDEPEQVIEGMARPSPCCAYMRIR